MPELTERERKILNKHTKSIINQLLKNPILQAKELANSNDAAAQLQLFQQIFGIEEDVEREVNQMQQKAQQDEQPQKANLEPRLSY